MLQKSFQVFLVCCGAEALSRDLSTFVLPLMLSLKKIYEKLFVIVYNNHFGSFYSFSLLLMSQSPQFHDASPGVTNTPQGSYSCVA